MGASERRELPPDLDLHLIVDNYATHSVLAARLPD